MRYATVSPARPSGPGGCPAQLDDPRAWANALPSWVVAAWSASNLVRLQSGITLIALLTPLMQVIAAAEIALYAVVRVLRADCTLSKFADDELRIADSILGFVAPFVPAQASAAIDVVRSFLRDPLNVPEDDLCAALGWAVGALADNVDLTDFPVRPEDLETLCRQVVPSTTDDRPLWQRVADEVDLSQRTTPVGQGLSTRSGSGAAVAAAVGGLGLLGTGIALFATLRGK